MDPDEIKNITCNVCGGTDFMREGGYYYCTECQTQTQEIRERHFEREDIAAKVMVESKIRTKKPKSGEKQVMITTWEGYNYILAGLTNELINLGASPELREVTYQLWISYLMELEILTKKGYNIPKLGASYTVKDAELVYQHQRKKRKRTKSISSASSVITDGTDLRSISREKKRQEKAMMVSEYESFTANTQSSDTSLLNQTLSNLGSSDDESLESEKFIKFNRVSKKELLKHMSRQHLRKHTRDYENEMTCHKKNKILSSSYLNSTFIITRNKIYSILYIGLLLTESDIQLSDLLRYCREGHLSFLSYNHLFPETYTEKQIDPKIYQIGNKKVPSHKNIRETSYRLFNMLKLGESNFSPNLKKLCEKYCTELNLPDEIKNMGLNLIDKTKPDFKMKTYKEGEIPNYEGRAMAFILLVLKLLFGLDGISEFQFSTFATNLNDHSHDNKMFNFADWIKFIEYRKVVLKSQHFPTCFLLDNHVPTNSNLFVHFLHKQQANLQDEQNKLSIELVRKLLTDLEHLQDDSIGNFLDFPVTLTPFHSYTQKLLQYDNILLHGNLLNKELLSDMTKQSVDFLLHPRRYMKALNGGEYVIMETSAVESNLMKIISKQELGDETILNENNWKKSFKQIRVDEFSMDKLERKLLQKFINGEQQTSSQKCLKASTTLMIPEYNTSKLPKPRDSTGRFCKKDSLNVVKTTEIKSHKKRGKWFLSSWVKNPLLEQNNCETTGGKSFENLIESQSRRKDKRKRTLSHCDDDKYNIHYQHYLEYWINVADMNEKQFNNFLWRDLKNSLPFTFTWLLNECALIIEQKAKDLFKEFVIVELFVIYVYLKKCPTITKTGDDNSEKISKLITRILKEW